MTDIGPAQEVVRRAERAEAEAVDVLKVANQVAWLARRMKVTPRTVRNWIVAGKITADRTPGGRWRIPDSEIARLAPAPK